MSKQINIGGRIHSTEVGNVSVGANEVFDDTKGKKQNVINSETDAELLRLDQSKQDNLTFDNAPTENSNNPVKSSGVYAADKALSDAIEAILLLIPSAATALNQLADKAFVNSSVSTATATFRGTYNVVTDLELAYDATHEQIATKLGQVIATADNNDYSFVQVPVSATSTDIRRTERYKFNGTVWGYEYDLNTSGFTQVQWEAINSGITALLVSKLTDLPSAIVLATMFDAKQNVLSWDAAPTAYSLNPVRSGGIYTAIQAITNLIPAEATVQNQLADKAYVLVSILAGTPAFKGQFTSLADLLVVASPKAGDLGIVRTKDNDGKDVFTFYQYLSNAWNVYYTLSYHPQIKPATTGTTGDYPYNGMGRVELPMNVREIDGVTANYLEQSMMPTDTGRNTIYVIQYDFTLGEDITIPANCVLEFDGGSISGNGTNKDIIIGNNTKIICNDYDSILLSVYVNGSWNKEYFTICNFGCKQGNDKGASNSSILNTFCNTSLNAITNNVALKVPQGVYNISTPVQLNASFDFICVGTLKYDGVIDNISALTIGSPGSNNGGYARKYVIALEGNLITYNYDESTQQYVIPENYGLKMYGMANSNIVINKVTNFAYCVTLIGNDRAFADNSIDVGYIMNSYRCLTLLCEGNGYVNENLIIGGRYYCEGGCSVARKHTAIALLGSDVHRINNNVFIKPDIEYANIGIYCTLSQDNTFIAPRTEQDTIPYYNNTVQFDNVVIYGNGSKAPSMIDLKNCRYRHIVGTDNLCRIKFGESSAYSCSPLYSANVNDGIVSTTNIVTNSAVLGGYFIDTSVFKDFIIENATSRAYIFVYDNNNQKIELTNENRNNYIKDEYLDLTNGGVAKGADSSATIIHLTDETKRIYVASRGGDNTLHVYCADCRYAGQNIVLTPFDSKQVGIASFPTQSINVKNGECLKINDRHVRYIIFVDGEWYASDGAVANIIRIGTTAQRPLGDKIYLGFTYIDTDLGSKPIFAKSIAPSTYVVTWVDATGTPV